MRICEKCGQEYDEHLLSCPHCGAVPDPSALEDATALFDTIMVDDIIPDYSPFIEIDSINKGKEPLTENDLFIPSDSLESDTLPDTQLETLSDSDSISGSDSYTEENQKIENDSVSGDTREFDPVDLPVVAVSATTDIPESHEDPERERMVREMFGESQKVTHDLSIGERFSFWLEDLKNNLFSFLPERKPKEKTNKTDNEIHPEINMNTVGPANTIADSPESLSYPVDSETVSTDNNCYSDESSTEEIRGLSDPTTLEGSVLIDDVSENETPIIPDDTVSVEESSDLVSIVLPNVHSTSEELLPDSAEKSSFDDTFKSEEKSLSETDASQTETAKDNEGNDLQPDLIAESCASVPSYTENYDNEIKEQDNSYLQDSSDPNSSDEELRAHTDPESYEADYIDSGLVSNETAQDSENSSDTMTLEPDKSFEESSLEIESAFSADPAETEEPDSTSIDYKVTEHLVSPITNIQPDDEISDEFDIPENVEYNKIFTSESIDATVTQEESIPTELADSQFTDNQVSTDDTQDNIFSEVPSDTTYESQTDHTHLFVKESENNTKLLRRRGLNKGVVIALALLLIGSLLYGVFGYYIPKIKAEAQEAADREAAYQNLVCGTWMSDVFIYAEETHPSREVLTLGKDYSYKCDIWTSSSDREAFDPEIWSVTDTNSGSYFLELDTGSIRVSYTGQDGKEHIYRRFVREVNANKLILREYYNENLTEYFDVVFERYSP